MAWVEEGLSVFLLVLRSRRGGGGIRDWVGTGSLCWDLCSG